jgi:hypothetical protein
VLQASELSRASSVNKQNWNPHAPLINCLKKVMARLCSVYFNHKDQEYFALVSIHQTGEEIVCQVRYANGGMHDVLGGQEFRLLQEEQQTMEEENDLLISLISSTRHQLDSR